MQLVVIDEDRIRRNNVVELCRHYDVDVVDQTNNVSLSDLQHPERQRIMFLHWNNYIEGADLAGVSKDVVIYSGTSIRDLSGAEQLSGKVFKIYRIIDRNTPFSENLKRGFIEILEYFNKGKKDPLPSLLEKTVYPDELFSVYLASIARERGVTITLRPEVEPAAKVEFERLSTKYFDTETEFNESNVKSMIEKIAEECSKS